VLLDLILTATATVNMNVGYVNCTTDSEQYPTQLWREEAFEMVNIGTLASSPTSRRPCKWFLIGVWMVVTHFASYLHVII
jgi:hypothetical protein